MRLIVILVTFMTMQCFGTIDACNCSYFHPQDIFCRAQFVGIVRITNANLNDPTENPGRILKAQMKILKIYKGRYSDVTKVDHVNLYAPNDVSCKGPYWEGNQIISGTFYQDGIFTDNCQFREPLDTFSPRQILTIQSHFRTRKYARGCSSCKIKEPYDFSYTFNNECQMRYNEFPVSTEACIPIGPERKCTMVRNQLVNVRVPRIPSPSSSPKLVETEPTLYIPDKPKVADTASSSSRPKLRIGLVEQTTSMLTTPTTTTAATTTPTTTTPTTTTPTTRFFSNRIKYKRVQIQWPFKKIFAKRTG